MTAGPAGRSGAATGPSAAAAGPSAAVLAAYGLTGPATLLAGGQGTSWCAGDLVFKPDRPEFAEWLATVLAGPFDGVRVAAPVRSADGRWGVDGWTAAPLLAGENSVAGRFADVFAAGRALHAGLPDVTEPDWSRARTDPWASADRIAWGAAPVGLRASTRATLDALLAPAAPVGQPAQLVHLDLAGNVLLDDVLPPAVIDLSPYWRPVAYARAVIAVDLVLWHGAPASVVDLAGLGADVAILLRRALAFRLVAHALAAPSTDLDAYSRAAQSLLGTAPE